MAQESCNLSKDEELLKPQSPPPSSLAPLLINHHHDSSFLKRKRTEKSMEETEAESITRRNRCGSCGRKVGLTGFRCRCGDLFCGQHRYSDSHDCTFDYKSFGRDQISKANPLIRPAKIIKI